MPRHLPIRLVAACVATLILSICGASAASARTVAANLRVVTTAGRVLADQTQYTDTVAIRTDKRADCLGPGSGGSGKTARIPGSTALGLAIDASRVNKAVRPASVSDSFDFGLAVCGFGGFKSSPNGYWYLKRNHRGALVGGDSLRVRRGDDILWYQSPTFTAPDELSLVAPGFVKPGAPFTVRVFRYDDKGRRKPARGATVPGADLPTGANGTTSVVIDQVTKLTARAKGLIPSNAATVCTSGIGTRFCTEAPIGGSGRNDVIRGTRRTDRISAGRGNDRINVRDRGRTRDRIDCGPGRDIVYLDPDDWATRCEVKKVS